VFFLAFPDLGHPDGVIVGAGNAYHVKVAAVDSQIVGAADQDGHHVVAAARLRLHRSDITICHDMSLR